MNFQMRDSARQLGDGFTRFEVQSDQLTELSNQSNIQKADLDALTNLVNARYTQVYELVIEESKLVKERSELSSG
jgi:PleD family two-component response regulator